jgi:ethylene receptor
MMSGSVRSALDGKTITLILQFQLQQSGVCQRTPLSIPHFDGLRILLADGDGMSQAVTQKLLEKLGFAFSPYSVCKQEKIKKLYKTVRG